MSISEKESRELFYRPKRKQSRAFEVSVMAAAGLAIVVIAIASYFR